MKILYFLKTQFSWKNKACVGIDLLLFFVGENHFKKKSRETFSTQTFWITCWVCGLNWWPLKLNLTQQSQKWSQRIFRSSGVVCVFGWNLFICMFCRLCTFSLAICVCSDFCTLHSVVIFCPKPVPFRLQHHNALSKACFHGQTGYQSVWSASGGGDVAAAVIFTINFCGLHPGLLWMEGNVCSNSICKHLLKNKFLFIRRDFAAVSVSGLSWKKEIL